MYFYFFVIKIKLLIILMKNKKHKQKDEKISSQNINNIDNSSSSLNISNSNNFTNINENKKITIRDLCPEEKQKIGELLKKLAEEKEEKEKLIKISKDDKKHYENTIENLIKEKEYLTTSNNNFNQSINLRSESFMIENFVPQTQTEEEQSSTSTIEMKNLKDRFNKLFETLKKTAQNQDDYFTKYTLTEENNSNNISSTLSMLKEEKPLILECRPTPIESCDTSKNNFTQNNFTPHNFNYTNTINTSGMDILQTSILNINDEIKENIIQNLYSDSKFILFYLILIF
jgi:hypothetical protein